MRLWIDAAALPESAVFGMCVLERHLRAAARSAGGFSAICVDCGDGPEPSIPAELRRRLAIEVRRRPGGADRRLARFLRESLEPLTAVAGDGLVDPRLFDLASQRPHGLVARDNGLALLVLENKHAAALEGASLAEIAQALLRSNAVDELHQDEFPAFIRGLRRVLPFWMMPVRTPAQRRAAEQFMFRANYKGSTDFFTKYVYPLPVWLLLRPLTRLRVHPNWITGLNVALAVAAIPAFALGHYLAGFLCAYAMSVLDSVDGKLARLTFADSKLGRLLDHGLDLIHPPLWYMAWAWGIAGGDHGDPVMVAGAMLVILYILDRLCLKVYSVNFHRGLHAHSPLDGVVRTFIARRNINLPLFTAGVALGFPLEAFLLIVAWQAATLVWHTCRVGSILLFESSAPAGGGGSLLAAK
ncbi:MAG: CDP-alcohol phosphatidyltransferase family protein [Reyranellaceae bacterium]